MHISFSLPLLVFAAFGVLAIDVAIRMYRANQTRKRHDSYQSKIKSARRW